MATQATFIFDVGQHVKDAVTGFVGVVTGRADFITGCNQYIVQPLMDKKSVVKPESNWIDETRLTLTRTKAITLPKQPKKKPGGPAHVSIPAGK